MVYIVLGTVGYDLEILDFFVINFISKLLLVELRRLTISLHNIFKVFIYFCCLFTLKHIFFLTFLIKKQD